MTNYNFWMGFDVGFVLGFLFFAAFAIGWIALTGWIDKIIASHND